MPTFKPTTPKEVADLVSWATGESATLEILAGGSKRLLGRPMQTDHVLDLSAIAGIVDYEPTELVLTAHAATPMVEIAALLQTQGQMLAFEPPDWRSLLGGGGEPTLGGTIACNLAGPRRVRAGAARDHFLGFTAINGWGDIWKSGSRVVKNVTGYDMCKLQSGAYGTLSVLTEISVKVMPRPETECSLLVPVVSDTAAIALLARALNTEHEVSAACYLPGAIGKLEGAVAVLRVEGPQPSVDYRADVLGTLLGAAGRLGALESRSLWASVGAVAPLLPTQDRLVWRICPTPSAAPAIVRQLRATFDSTRAFYDWGGGLVWLSIELSETGDAGAAAVRAAVGEAVGEAGGHATLVRAPTEIRSVFDVFEPLAGPIASLTARIKAGFDPRGTLNPHRMHKAA